MPDWLGLHWRILFCWNYESNRAGVERNRSSTTGVLANVIVGCINLAGTIVALVLVDRAGRRPLLLATFCGMALSLSLLAMNIHSHPALSLSLIFILIYVGCFAIGVGPTVWIVMAEIFPTTVRGRAMSLATVILWLACLLITSTFLTLVKSLSVSGAFLLYAGLSLIAAVFVFLTVPETKERSLEEIERFWQKKVF